MISRPKVLVFGPIHEKGMQILETYTDPVMSLGHDEKTIFEQAQEVDGIIIRALGRITAQVMDAAPRLKVVGRHGVGVDNVEVDAATQRGIWVVNTPLAVTEPVAEHVVGMMIAAIKDFNNADRMTRAGDWNYRHSIEGFELVGKTLGVIGMGRIGFRTAEICRKGFGMRIVYTDAIKSERAESELQAERLDLFSLLAISDIVTIHTPYLPETHYLINEQALRHMKRTAYLINAARGKVVEQEALVRALEERWIAGAALDVFEQEPPEKDNPLFALNNVLLTPHVATSTRESLIGMSLVAEDVVAILRGEVPKFPVNRPVNPRAG